MKKLLLLFALFSFAAPSLLAQGGVETNSGACAHSSPGSGVTCQKYFYANSTTGTCGTTATISYTPSSSANAFVVFAFNFGTSSSCTNASSATISFSDNKSDSFSTTPTTPMTIGTGTFYVSYLKSISSGVTSFTLTCSIANACAFLSFFGIEWSGAATSGPFQLGEGDWYANGATNLTSLTVSTGNTATSSATKNIGYKNTFSVGYFTTNANEVSTASAPYVDLMAGVPNTNNPTNGGENIQGYGVASGGVQSTTATWTGNDGAAGIIEVFSTTQTTPATMMPLVLGSLLPRGPYER